jgi:hypothetical protein
MLCETSQLDSTAPWAAGSSSFSGGHHISIVLPSLPAKQLDPVCGPLSCPVQVISSGHNGLKPQRKKGWLCLEYFIKKPTPTSEVWDFFLLIHFLPSAFFYSVVKCIFHELWGWLWERRGRGREKKEKTDVAFMFRPRSHMRSLIPKTKNIWDLCLEEAHLIL